ncbi:MAG: GvpL/GvpF family gas vesicle protein [Bacteroidota bacterium]
MTKDLLYVYCVSNIPVGLVGNLGSKGLKSFMFDDFFVIAKYVSDSEYTEENFKKKISDVKWLEHNAREHLRVIRSVMEYSDVIPFKFGTVFTTKARLKNFIIEYSASLFDNFLLISEKEEWAVKIYCDRKTLSEKIDEVSEEAALLEKQIMESSPGKAYLLNRKKTELIENEMNRLCKTYGQAYYEKFKNLCETTSLNNLLPKEFTGRDDNMILNANFLVNKNNVKDFRSLEESLKNKDGNFGFFIEVTGPWPPFSFISIKEK